DREPRRLSAPRARLVRPAPAPRLADRMSPDAVVVGAGPNGLSAAIALAREGLSVSVLEANDTIGGGCRSAALTLPGFLHDVCSAFHPMGAASPFFRALDLGREGLEWIEPPAALTGSFALMFAVTTHVANWPIPRGGSQRIADALAARLRSLGGAVVTGQRVGDIGELPAAKAILFDVTPLQLDRIAGSRLDSG